MTAPTSGGTMACDRPLRTALVRDGAPGAPPGPPLNAIDYLEVLDADAPPNTPRQQTLLVHCVRTLGPLEGANVRIDGGVRIRPVGVVWAAPASTVIANTGGSVDFQRLASYLDDTLGADAARTLVVRTATSGDFSTYTLRLVQSPVDERPPSDFDRLLATADFSFKVECESGFDCQTEQRCTTPATTSPQIDYLAKDYASFRRLMLDRLAITMPTWRERNPSDVGVAVVETLAYVADHLSYYQDAVATEAYLGTARARTSVRRHARLLDYAMHDGANARAWMAVDVTSAGDGLTLPAGTIFLTRVDARRRTLGTEEGVRAAGSGAEVFESLHAARFREARNEIRFHTWGDERCCLPRGATRAALRTGGAVAPGAGDLLLLEEVRSPDGLSADPSHRHVVRLTSVVESVDPLFPDPANLAQPLPVLEVEWAADDALPFPLCLWEIDVGGHREPVSVARGNLVLVDHGRTIANEELAPQSDDASYRPRLARAPLTQQRHVRAADGRLLVMDPSASASSAMQFEMVDARPAITLSESGDAAARWDPQRDLLGSGRFASDFVVEMEDDGSARLRFGDGITGRRPAGALTARYRIGSGRSGNVGAGAIAHVVSDAAGVDDAAIAQVRNPLPARGGTDPEPSSQVQLYAPQAFRRQERAITEQDYADAAERHAEVQRAAATRRWTGSWYTMFVTIDRAGGRPIDDAFERTMREHLERYRLAGYDIEVDAPRFVPLEIAMRVCVKPGYFRSAVKAALLDALGTGDLADGQRGFFHPDNLTFGQPVYLSQLVAAAVRVPGVASVDVTTFKRWGRAPGRELYDAQIPVGRLEIARLDNDANAAENGQLDLDMAGGL